MFYSPGADCRPHHLVNTTHESKNGDDQLRTPSEYPYRYAKFGLIPDGNKFNIPENKGPKPVYILLRQSSWGELEVFPLSYQSQGGVLGSRRTRLGNRNVVAQATR